MISLLPFGAISTVFAYIFCSELVFFKSFGPFLFFQAHQDAETKQGGSEVLKLCLKSTEGTLSLC